MKKAITIISLLLCVLLNKESKAQASLGFNPNFFPNFPFAKNLGDSGSFHLSIQNFSNNTSFNGAITLVTQVMGGALSIDTSNYIPQTSIAPNDTVGYNFQENYSPNRFAVGIDVVVIWPKSVGATTHDSIMYVVQISDPSSVASILNENGISIYPNPFANTFIIENRHPSNPIEQVRVFDLSGKLILSKTREEIIDLSSIPNDLYVVELFYKSGMRKVMKVQKQE